MTDVPPQTWALIGVVVTAIAAFVRERMLSTASPYDQMAGRLAVVEARAALMPLMRAQLAALGTWSDEAAHWMVELEAAWKELTGEHYFPPPPLPPPRWDRRLVDFGPPRGTRDRRDDGTL